MLPYSRQPLRYVQYLEIIFMETIAKVNFWYLSLNIKCLKQNNFLHMPLWKFWKMGEYFLPWNRTAAYFRWCQHIYGTITSFVQQFVSYITQQDESSRILFVLHCGFESDTITLLEFINSATQRQISSHFSDSHNIQLLF